VLVCGGQLESGSSTATAELFDPATETFTATGTMETVRQSHQATLLSNGKVLISGGAPDNMGTGTIESAEIYDPATGLFTTAGNMTVARAWHSAVLLGNGQVMIAGGHQENVSNGFLASAEIYDPSKGTFTATSGHLSEAKSHPTATLLPSGKVLVTGGDGYNSALGYSVSLSSADLFH